MSETAAVHSIPLGGLGGGGRSLHQSLLAHQTLPAPVYLNANRAGVSQEVRTVQPPAAASASLADRVR